MNLKPHLKNIYIVGILLISSIALHFLQSKPETESTEPQQEEADLQTMIPRNHSLIPIEIKNSESLDSIFGNYGLVNLYIDKDGKQILVAKNIRLLRAPRNPSHFAVLVKDSESTYITKYDQEFYVSISSNKNSGTVFVQEKKGQQQIQVGLEND